ncbi:MAG: hypothetical protein ABJM36_13280 [Algibacter sp.]|uniref:hypothetical protein n=1 Tax=Algibacter sp. TaxID=1872428 RepID=UPI0032977FD6
MEFKITDVVRLRKKGWLRFRYCHGMINGYKTDVPWVTFTYTNGKGIKIEGLQLLGFSGHHQ